MTTTTANAQQMLAAAIDAENAAWAHARTANLPLWIENAHPGALTGIDRTKVNPAHLADLYPNIWTWGPHGETYITQINHMHNLLNLADSTDGIDNAFVADIYTGLDSMNPIADDTTILGDLVTHAITTGHPIRGNMIFYGTDPTSPTHHYPAILISHPIWQRQRGSAADCEEFLYNFTLLSIHRDFFINLDDERVHTALTDYDAFCTVWGIPT